VTLGWVQFIVSLAVIVCIALLLLDLGVPP